MSTTPPTIYQKMCKVMSQISGIGKSQIADEGYSFRGIDDVMAKLHPLLVQEGIFVTQEIIKSVQTEKQNLFHTFIKVKYNFISSEGDSISTECTGEALDKSDKGIGKALATSLKYCLTTMFMIPTTETKNIRLEDVEKENLKPATKVETQKENKVIVEPDAQAVEPKHFLNSDFHMILGALKVNKNRAAQIIAELKKEGYSPSEEQIAQYKKIFIETNQVQN